MDENELARLIEMATQDGEIVLTPELAQYLATFGGFNNNNSDDDGETGLYEEDESEEESEEETDSEEEEEKEGREYETNLSTLHSYLGEVDDLRGAEGGMLEEGKVAHLPLFCLHGVVLFPGETLPLRIFHPREIWAIEDILKETSSTPQQIIAVIHASYGKKGGVGTTAKIRGFRREGGGQMVVVTEGLQRFKILSFQHQEDSAIPIASVLILPESSPSSLPLSLSLLPPQLTHSSSPKVMEIRQKMHLSLSPLPSFLWAHSDPLSLTHQVSLQLGSLSPPPPTPPTSPSSVSPPSSSPSSSSSPPSSSSLLDQAKDPSSQIAHKREPTMDACRFSYWVAHNVPMGDASRQRLLECSTTSERLKQEVEFLKKFNPIQCRRCSALLSHRTNIFSMSTEGNIGTYVNPHGCIHQLITVKQISSVKLVGRRCAEDSWFPGYSWTILNCGNCGGHVGWRFTADEKELRPRKFWGLRRNALQMGTEIKEPNNE